MGDAEGNGERGKVQLQGQGRSPVQLVNGGVMGVMGRMGIMGDGEATPWDS